MTHLRDVDTIQHQESEQDRASEEVQRLVAKIVAVAGPIWSWGDGQGGWVVQELGKAARAVGLTEPTIPTPPSGKAKAVRVFERDRYRCCHCGTWLDLTVDHIRPRIRGGNSAMENLQTLCRTCNSRKGTK